MKKKLIYLMTAVLSGIMVSFSACTKDGDSRTDGTAKLQIRMTDAPGNFSKINLSVKEIVLISNGKPYTFTANANIFNILDFRIGTSKPDILVASGEMPAGDITEIRLVLNDSGNTIVVDGGEQALTIPSGQSSGWKVKLTENPSLLPGASYSLLLDFDAAKSIVSTGNGRYILKPVVRGVATATSGLISGAVLPLESHPEILVIAGADTVGTVPDPLTGKFTVGGLAAGTYSVKFSPVAGYRDSTVTNIAVSAGRNTDLGTVTLKQ
ncbi:DUF4382 domain-containing protein [Pararcticibacter amylolyticus]|uniref:DUF4382 domain-containing protein n=1 Tax=Pararcticibacter amylolyticus TaxID=2173175 RepID=A0A2U2PD65_9SPHI|nr:DUF4382 domain-containing protein [Pararcticibacter amylolyticus]PWG79254.1 hypothetical protein DDR33_18390 [Pararcticibacter amylolyticus]